MTQPIYQVIIEKLKQQIATMDPNVPIRSERELAQLFEVSRMTVRKAVQFLVDDGYLYRDGNLGTFVADQKLRKNIKEQQSRELFESDSDYRILYFDLKNGGDAITKRLEIGNEDQYIRIVRLNQIANAPESIDEIYIAHQHIPHADLSNIERILEFSASNATGTLKQEFVPIRVPVSYANLLKLELDTPIIMVENTVYTQFGRVFSFIISYKNPQNSHLKFVF